MSDMSSKELRERLADPFDPSDIEWRVQAAGIGGGGNPYAMVLAYIDARAVQNRLDSVVGPERWSNEVKPSPCGKGYLCGISIKFGSEWITKWDGASTMKGHEVKGTISDAEKRAAVQWGIGRYLYQMTEVFADCKFHQNSWDCRHNKHYHKDAKNGGRGKGYIDWITPELPSWALPTVEKNEYLKSISESSTLAVLKSEYHQSILFARARNNKEIEAEMIRAKDAAKKRIESDIASKKCESASKVSEYLLAQIKNLNSMPGIAAVDTLAHKVVESIEKEGFDKKIDVSEHIQTWKKSVESKKQELDK